MTTSTTVKCDGEHLWTVKDTVDGTIKTLKTSEIMKENQGRYLFPATDGGWFRIKRTRELYPEPVKCIEVDDPEHLYSLENGLLTHNTGGGKSVLERNIIFHVIAHSDEIKLLGIDLKRVELSNYKKYSKAVLGIATTLEDAVEILRFAQETMMSRYAEMESVDAKNFLEMKNAGSALMVLIDEAGELLDTSAPAKALADNTIVPNLENKPDLGHIETGDHVLGEDGEWHEVTEKIKPEAQQEYRLTFKRESDGSKESFIAGEEHLWTVTIDDKDIIMTTRDLKKLYNNTPEGDRKNITFRRAKRIADK